MSSSRVSRKSASPAKPFDRNSLDLSVLRKEFDQADGFTKEVQAFRERAGVPAQNELRNVGYHLLYALTDNSEPPEDQIIKAVNHCRRASYEAAEAGIITALGIINIFKDDYRGMIVSEVVADWHEILVDCEQCKDDLASSREKGDDRNSDYKMHMDAFRKLSGYCKRLQIARDELNLKIKDSIATRRKFVLTTLLALLAIFVSIIAIF